MDLSPALQKIFPLTFSLLSEQKARALEKEFSRDWSLEQIHFFPMLVRHLKYSPQIIEVADYEYLKHWLKEQKVSRVSSAAPFVLNPTVQFVWIEEASKILNKSPGLYAIWKWGEQEFEVQLSSEEAKILDRLQEDQIFLQSELKEDQKLVLFHLISLHLILENISQTELHS